jgi:hypothetical protein
MHQKLFHYHSYILRFWKEEDDREEEGNWRFTLLDPTQGHRYGFNNLEDLFAFFEEQMKEN